MDSDASDTLQLQPCGSKRKSDGQIEIHKILGTENPGDVFTKYVNKNVMEAALKKMNLAFKEGRSPIAPAIMGQSG